MLAYVEGPRKSESRLRPALFSLQNFRDETLHPCNTAIPQVVMLKCVSLSYGTLLGIVLSQCKQLFRVAHSLEKLSLSQGSRIRRAAFHWKTDTITGFGFRDADPVNIAKCYTSAARPKQISGLREPFGRSQNALVKRMRSSEFSTGAQYHIAVSPGDLAPYILLCGDPERAERIVSRFDSGSILLTKRHREFVTLTGTYQGLPVSVIGTGIGPDNTEIAVIEASLCVEQPTFIRVGSCGAIQPSISIGDLVITREALPRENTSSFYLPAGTRVHADPVVVGILEKAAEELEYTYHVGTTCSTSSFYGGQGREVPGFPLQEASKREKVFPKLIGEGVLNFDMEASALLTLATVSTLGLRAGAICAVYAQRERGTGFDSTLLMEAENRCVQVGLRAIQLLVERGRNGPKRSTTRRNF
jgi:uridine phosphorylase